MATTYITRTMQDGGNHQQGTFSFWVKRGLINDASDTEVMYRIHNGGDYFQIAFEDTDSLLVRQVVSSSNTFYIKTKKVFCDPTAWYHIVIAIDTTQATNVDRIKVYANGTQIPDGSLDSPGYPAQNTNLMMGEAYASSLGGNNAANYFTGIFSHFVYCDGNAYAATNFGESNSTTGQWQFKAPSGVSYGTTGWYLFKDNASLTDQSGLGNNWSSGAGTLTPTMDNPSNNYNVWDTSSFDPSGLNIQNGNLSVARNGSYLGALGTHTVWGGKWYWEVKYNQANWQCGVIGYNAQSENMSTYFMSSSGNGFPGKFDYGYSFGLTNGNSEKWNSSSSGTSWGGVSGASTGDIFQYAFDATTRAIWIGRNGTWLNSATQTEIENGTTTNAMYSSMGSSDFWWTPAVGITNNNTSEYLEANFGNGYFGTTDVTSATTDGEGEARFEYTVPTGYYALNTKNIVQFGG